MKTVALVVALVLVGAGCAGDPGPDEGGRAPKSTASTPGSAPPPVPPSAGAPVPSPTPTKRRVAAPPLVILISVDGLNPSAIRRLDRQGRVPAFRKLLREGSWTLNARTAHEQTNTLPNHTGMLTGRPITGRSGTRVTFNEDRPGNLASLNGRYVAGVFDPVHDAGLSTAFLAEKDKFNFLIRSWNAAGGARDVTGKDDGRNKLDVARIAGPQKLTRVLLRRLRSDPPNLTFLHIGGADGAGHGDKVNGFMGPRYLDAVVAADRQIGRILALVEARPALEQRTTVVLTADHGGRGTASSPAQEHRNPTNLDNYRIPFIVWGRGTVPGTDLYAQNRKTRRNPGDARTSYAGTQPIRNLDAADLVLSLFRLPALPGTLPRGLETLRLR
ncbi:hypothetical protein ABIE44_001159 [Marmoricola sp. OAE513]|uniref:alkaline phosphatase family protein n=1 Tax=Marmoricola sp. OAE513 TaxID=2817894 RepID=UPI001AE722E6